VTICKKVDLKFEACVTSYTQIKNNRGPNIKPRDSPHVTITSLNISNAPNRF